MSSGEEKEMANSEEANSTLVPPTEPPLPENDVDSRLQTQSSGTDIANDAVEDQSLSQVVESLENVQLSEENEFAQVKIEGEDDRTTYSHPFPLRPHAIDCTFFLKTGTCKFGLNCRFNHPLGVPYQANGHREKEIYGSSEDVGKIKCKYYLTPGGCKFGASCKYDHPKGEIGTGFNFLGLPIRPGERECPFYMRNGSCKYEANCKFHHPDPTEANEEPKSCPVHDEYGGRGNHSHAVSRQAAEASLFNHKISENGTSYGPLGSPLHGMLHNNSWSQFQANLPLPIDSMNPRLNHSLNNFSKRPDFVHLQQQMQIEEYPERPGQPECAFYMKTGNCKYKSACKYHHPRSRINTNLTTEAHSIQKSANSFVHPEFMQVEEFPERPGQPECEYFMKTGDCKFRSNCHFHHPRSRLPKLSHQHFGASDIPSRPVMIPPLENRKPTYLPPNYSIINETKTFSHHHQQQQQQITTEEFPERPGQPVCDYYIKTGNCKYKSLCRFHHPKNQAASAPLCALNSIGLPLRPGAKTCRNFEQQGFCKFGSNCLFDHPDISSPSIPVVHSKNMSSSAAPVFPASGSLSGNHQVADDWDDGWAM